MSYYPYGPTNPEVTDLSIRFAGVRAERDRAVELLESRSRALNEAEAEIERLEKAAEIERSSVANLAVPLGLAGTGSEILAHLRDYKKIQAIKLLRDRTGMGLKASKDAVEVMAAVFYPGLYDTVMEGDRIAYARRKDEVPF